MYGYNIVSGIFEISNQLDNQPYFIQTLSLILFHSLKNMQYLKCLYELLDGAADHY